MREPESERKNSPVICNLQRRPRIRANYSSRNRSIDARRSARYVLRRVRSPLADHPRRESRSARFWLLVARNLRAKLLITCNARSTSSTIIFFGQRDRTALANDLFEFANAYFPLIVGLPERIVPLVKYKQQ